MILCWVGAAVGEAEKSFRRRKGYRDMPKLVAALKKRDAPNRTTKDAVDLANEAA